MKKFSKIIDILFLIISVLTILEFIFIRGMFTGIFACMAVTILGIIESIFCIKNKKYFDLFLVLIIIVSIVSGYYVVINF